MPSPVARSLLPSRTNARWGRSPAGGSNPRAADDAAAEAGEEEEPAEDAEALRRWRARHGLLGPEDSRRPHPQPAPAVQVGAVSVLSSSDAATSLSLSSLSAGPSDPEDEPPAEKWTLQAVSSPDASAIPLSSPSPGPRTRRPLSPQDSGLLLGSPAGTTPPGLRSVCNANPTLVPVPLTYCTRALLLCPTCSCRAPEAFPRSHPPRPLTLPRRFRRVSTYWWGPPLVARSASESTIKSQIADGHRQLPFSLAERIAGARKGQGGRGPRCRRSTKC